MNTTLDFLNKIILEKNYYYNIPKDKELLMYDFYMIAHLNGLKKEKRFEPGDKKHAFGYDIQTPTRSMGIDENTLYSFEEIKSQIIEYLQDHLLEAALFAISCEFSHIYEKNTTTDIDNRDDFDDDEKRVLKRYKHEYSIYNDLVFNKKEPEFQDFLQKGYRRDKEKYRLKIPADSFKNKVGNPTYNVSYIAAKKTLKKEKFRTIDFVRLAEKAFRNLQWKRFYGGIPWANICSAFEQLYYANTEEKKIIAIDNMYHQQHNTDTVFNKLGIYYKAVPPGSSGDGFSWILDALNFKADVKDNWDRIRKIKSLTPIRQIDKMYMEMLKASGDKSYEQYSKETEEIKKETGFNYDNFKKYLTESYINTVDRFFSLHIDTLSDEVLEQLMSGHFLLIGRIYQSNDIIDNISKASDKLYVQISKNFYSLNNIAWNPQSVNFIFMKDSDVLEVLGKDFEPELENIKNKLKEFFKDQLSKLKDSDITFEDYLRTFISQDSVQFFKDNPKAVKIGASQKLLADGTIFYIGKNNDLTQILNDIQKTGKTDISAYEASKYFYILRGFGQLIPVNNADPELLMGNPIIFMKKQDILDVVGDYFINTLNKVAESLSSLFGVSEKPKINLQFLNNYLRRYIPKNSVQFFKDHLSKTAPYTIKKQLADGNIYFVGPLEKLSSLVSKQYLDTPIYDMLSKMLYYFYNNKLTSLFDMKEYSDSTTPLFMSQKDILSITGIDFADTLNKVSDGIKEIIGLAKTTENMDNSIIIGESEHARQVIHTALQIDAFFTATSLRTNVFINDEVVSNVNIGETGHIFSSVKKIKDAELLDIGDLHLFLPENGSIEDFDSKIELYVFYNYILKPIVGTVDVISALKNSNNGKMITLFASANDLKKIYNGQFIKIVENTQQSIRNHYKKESINPSQKPRIKLKASKEYTNKMWGEYFMKQAEMAGSSSSIPYFNDYVHVGVGGVFANDTPKKAGNLGKFFNNLYTLDPDTKALEANASGGSDSLHYYVDKKEWEELFNKNAPLKI